MRRMSIGGTLLKQGFKLRELVAGQRLDCAMFCAAAFLGITAQTPNGDLFEHRNVPSPKACPGWKVSHRGAGTSIVACRDNLAVRMFHCLRGNLCLSDVGTYA